MNSREQFQIIRIGFCLFVCSAVNKLDKYYPVGNPNAFCSKVLNTLNVWQSLITRPLDSEYRITFTC